MAVAALKQARVFTYNSEALLHAVPKILVTHS